MDEDLDPALDRLKSQVYDRLMCNHPAAPAVTQLSKQVRPSAADPHVDNVLHLAVNEGQSLLDPTHWTHSAARQHTSNNGNVLPPLQRSPGQPFKALIAVDIDAGIEVVATHVTQWLQNVTKFLGPIVVIRGRLVERADDILKCLQWLRIGAEPNDAVFVYMVGPTIPVTSFTWGSLLTQFPQKVRITIVLDTAATYLYLKHRLVPNTDTRVVTKVPALTPWSIAADVIIFHTNRYEGALLGFVLPAHMPPMCFTLHDLLLRFEQHLQQRNSSLVGHHHHHQQQVSSPANSIHAYVSSDHLLNTVCELHNGGCATPIHVKTSLAFVLEEISRKMIAAQRHRQPNLY
eukprot:PhF_6_TR27877/c0_g1_i2/m.40793